jgi:hypothetical protein
MIKRLALTLVVLTVLAYGARDKMLNDCSRAWTDELAWEWRLRTREVQNDPEVREITKGMYDRASDLRVEVCTRQYRWGLWRLL